MSDLEYVIRLEKRLAKARAILEEPLKLGSVTVQLDGQGYSATLGAPFLAGTCSACGAKVVTSARDRRDMSSHALTIARAFCCANGHRQDYGVLRAERYRNFPLDADPEDGR